MEDLEDCNNILQVFIKEEREGLFNTIEKSINEEDCCQEYQQDISLSNLNSCFGTNPAYLMISRTREGRDWIDCYNYENHENNINELLEKKKKTYFSLRAIARILLWEEIDQTNSYDIPPSRLEALAKWTSEVFPRYSKDTFYKNANSHPRGAFQSCYETIRERSIAIKNIQLTKKRKLIANDIPYSDDFESLKVKVSVIDPEYVNKWGRTAVQEKIRFFQSVKAQNIAEKLEHFPNLVHPNGYTLIQADFDTYYEKGPNLFNENWPPLARRLYLLAEKKKFFSNVIKTILESNKDVQSSEVVSNLGLILLPHLFKQILKKPATKKKPNWYPEKNFVLDSFILHIKETDHFEEVYEKKISQIKTTLADHSIELQPFVLIIGSSLTDLLHIYVVIGKYRYEVPTLLSGVDACFKLFKVLQEPFPLVCNHVWHFLENQIYGFENKGVKAVIDLITQIS